MTVFFPDVHTSNHAIGTTATFTKIPTQSQAAWVNESPSAKVLKKNAKKNACSFYIVIISQKTFQNLGCSPVRCTKNEQHTEEWALFFGHVRSVEARTSVIRDFLPLYFLHIGSTPSLSKVHIAVFRASSSSSLLAWKSATDAVIELTNKKNMFQLPNQPNQWLPMTNMNLLTVNLCPFQQNPSISACFPFMKMSRPCALHSS